MTIAFVRGISSWGGFVDVLQGVILRRFSWMFSEGVPGNDVPVLNFLPTFSSVIQLFGFLIRNRPRKCPTSGSFVVCPISILGFQIF